MSVSIGELLPAILILFPIVVLIRHYQLTRSKDYLIFSVGFLAILFEILLDVLFQINQLPNLENTGYSDNLYLLLVKLRYLNFTIPATMFYFVGKRARFESVFDRRSIIIMFWWFLNVILVFQMDLVEIPQEADLGFINTRTTVEAGQIGVMFLTDNLSFGQGYEFLLIIYQTACISYLLYSFISIENTYNYHNFKRIVAFWSITLSIFLLGNVFILLYILDIQLLNLDQIEVVQFFSFLLVAVMSIFYSEGLLLSEIQINRVFQLYHEKDMIEKEKEKRGFASVFMSKPIDYLRHVELYYDDSEIPKD